MSEEISPEHHDHDSEDHQHLQQHLVQRSLDSHGNPKLILYNYRWAILACYGLALVAVGMLSGTCTTIANLLIKVYGLSMFESNLTNFVFYIMYVPGTFAAMVVLEKYGVKVSIVIGALFLLLGAWIRLFILFSEERSFTAYFIGAFIAAFGQPFLMNIPSKIATLWFGDKERAMATAVGAVSSPIGSVISFVLPQAFVQESDLADIMAGQRHFCFYLLVQTMVVTLCIVPALAFIRERPPSPPSVVANETDNHMGFKEGMKELVSNRNYVLLFITFNFIYAIQASMGAIYANLASMYNYPMSSNSMCCLLFLVGGILNSFFLGSLLDKYQSYKKLVIIVSACSLVTTILHFGSLPLHNVMLEGVTMLLIGMSVVPITTVSFAFSVELAFPVPEAMTNGMMITISLLCGTGVGFLCTSLAEQSPLYALAFWSGSALLSLSISFFIEQDLRRLYLDDVKNSEYLEEDDVRRQSFE